MNEEKIKTILDHYAIATTMIKWRETLIGYEATRGGSRNPTSKPVREAIIILENHINTLLSEANHQSINNKETKKEVTSQENINKI
jgi:hypothetical protein